jgi:hypothetical protein
MWQKIASLKFKDVSLFQVNNKLEAAAQMNWASGNESVNFQVGMKYIIDPISSVKVMIPWIIFQWQNLSSCWYHG